MTTNLKIGLALGAVVLAVASYAAAQMNRQMVPALGTYTFPDGTVVNTASVPATNGSLALVVQIKTPAGGECYGMASGLNGAQYSSISCK